MIDDVLLVNIKRHEQPWIIERFYKPSQTGLTTKLECISPDPIHHMDLTILFDKHGVHTEIYDKREELEAKGLMGTVRRYPHHDSALSISCRYSTLVGHLHRLHVNNMRRANFAEGAVQRIVKMRKDDYNLNSLLKTLGSFMVNNYIPKEKATGTRIYISREVKRRLRVEEDTTG